MISCVVVDTETTGLRASDSRVIEVGAVRIEDGEVTGRFASLVNPGVSVPRRITRLTGIRTVDLVDAPPPDRVWNRFREFTGDAVLVAHNAGFDRSFVRAEYDRLGLEGPAGDWLCTVRLTRRLLPGLSSRSLDSVARFLGIPVGVRHRALADAEVTAGVLLALAGRAASAGVQDVRGLLGLQASRYATVHGSMPHVEQIRRDVVPALPESPGVYRMHDAAGRVLYVGKATSLRDRVGSYFIAVEAKNSRLRELVRRIRTVTFDVTPTEIEARVREARLILALQPPFNRAQRAPGRRAWVRVRTTGPGRRRVSVHGFRGEGPDTWIGPVGSGSEARGLAELTAAAIGAGVERATPRSSAERERQERLEAAAERVRRVLDAAGASGPFAPQDLGALVTGPLESAMREAAAELAFEEARVLRDWIDLVGRLPDAGSVPIAGGDVAALRTEPDGSVEVLLARDGRFLGSARGHAATVGEEWRRAVAGLLDGGAGAEHAAPGDPLARRALEDERRMIARWIREHGAAAHARASGESGPDFLRRVLDPPGPGSSVRAD